MSTMARFERRWFNPRMDTCTSPGLVIMNSTPATRRSDSPMTCKPESRRSCAVMMVVEFGASSGFWAAREEETTCSS